MKLHMIKFFIGINMLYKFGKDRWKIVAVGGLHFVTDGRNDGRWLFLYPPLTLLTGDKNHLIVLKQQYWDRQLKLTPNPHLPSIFYHCKMANVLDAVWHQYQSNTILRHIILRFLRLKPNVDLIEINTLRLWLTSPLRLEIECARSLQNPHSLEQAA